MRIKLVGFNRHGTRWWWSLGQPGAVEGHGFIEGPCLCLRDVHDNGYVFIAPNPNARVDCLPFVRVSGWSFGCPLNVTYNAIVALA